MPTPPRLPPQVTRHLLTAASLLCALIAVVAVAWPTLTNLAADRNQDELHETWSKLPPATTTTTTAPLARPNQPTTTAPATTTTPEPADVPQTPDGAVARLVIADLDVDQIVVDGVKDSDLRRGPGHYPDTAGPGQAGNFAVAGHRTTYGGPFRDLDDLELGATIEVTDTSQQTYTYKVSEKPFVVANNDWSVIEAPKTASTLTLTTCHPKGSARQRLVVRAELVG